MKGPMSIICVRLHDETIARLNKAARANEKFQRDNPELLIQPPVTRSEIIRQAIMSGLDVHSRP